MNKVFGSILSDLDEFCCVCRVSIQWNVDNNLNNNNNNNNNNQLHYDRSVITHQTIRNYRLNIVMLDNIIKEAYFIDVAIPNSHTLHSATTGKFQKYTGFKEELIRIWQLKTACIIPKHYPQRVLLHTNYTKNF